MKIIFFFFLVLTQSAQAQVSPSDSLEIQFSKARSDTQKLKILKQIVDIYSGTDMKKALIYAKRGVAFADKSHQVEWQPKFYETEGRIHANLLELDSAMQYFTKALKGYQVVGNKRGQATTFFKIAWVYKKKGDMDKAMQADMNAMGIMEKLGDKLGMAISYENISEDLTRQERFEDALKYAKKALDICKENDLKTEMVYALTNAGSVAIHSTKNKEAFKYFDEALRLAKEQNFDEVSLCDFTNNRGNSLKRLGKYKEALVEYNTALNLAKKTNYTNAISATIANLGEVNLLMGKYKQALPYQLETVHLQEMDNDLSNIVENYLHVSTIYEHLGDFKSALAYQKKALKIRDSTASAASDTAMSGMLARYETKKQAETILSQQKEISQQKKIQWMGAGIGLLLLGFLVFGFFSYRIRTRNNRLLAAKNNENELLLKEIHHRVKNNLAVVSSLLELQSAQIEDVHTKDALKESQNRVQSIGIVHQKLYLGKDRGAIEMKDYFLHLSESILDSFGAEKRVSIELAMENLDVDIDTAVPLGLIVNELLTNTLKYAFPEGMDGKVRIKLEKKKDSLYLEVADNGIGKVQTLGGTGFGTQLIRLLTRQLSGEMYEEIKNGTRTFFDFKIYKAT